VIVENFGWCPPVECLAGAAVEGSGDSVEVVASVLGQVGALREVLAQQAGQTRWEQTSYRGTHWIEAFVVKDGVCLARSGRIQVRVQ